MTSTIYTARHLPSGNATIPLFSLKGIDDHAPAPISTLGITGVPLKRQVAYAQYASNIACFIYAASIRKTVSVNGQPLGLLPQKNRLPLPAPTVNFTLKKAINSDNSTKLLRALGPGASTNISGKTTIFCAPVIPDESIDLVINMCPPHFNCGRDAVNPAGALAFRFISSICSNFLLTHSYPAFSEETESTLVELNFLLAGHTKFYNFIAKDKDGKETQAFDPALYSRTLQDLAETAGAMDTDEEHISKLKTPTGRITSNGIDAVLKAKPCPKYQKNIGTRSEAPNLPGVLFPYFHGLVQPDAVYLHTTLLHHFFQIMGNTIQECQNLFLVLRRGCGSLSTTKEGMVLTHLLKGITLALETQSRCYMLYEANDYKGFVLYGAQFIVFDSTKWVVPGSEAEITSALSLLDPHEASVNKLVEMFGKFDADEYAGPKVTPSIFQEPKNLIDVFRGLNMTELDDADAKEIDKYLRGLNYMGEGYWTRNPQTIVDSLKIIASEGSVELTRPTYLPSIKIPIHTKEFAALSKFGPESYSFWNEKGTEISCKPSEKHVLSAGKRKAGELDLYANMPVKILATPKPLSVALSDMSKVLSRGSIKIDLSERAGRYRNISVESVDMRKAIWRELIEITSGSAGNKRLRVDDTEDKQIDFDDLLFKLMNSGGVKL